MAMLHKQQQQQGPLPGLSKLRRLQLVCGMPGNNAQSLPGVYATKDARCAACLSTRVQRHNLLCCRQPNVLPTPNKARIVQDF